MTGYATTDDLRAALGAQTYGRLTDPSFFTPGTPTFDRGADALTRAAAEIDSYLCRQYALPLPRVPAVLRAVACDIAYYRLHTAPPDELVTRYDKAVRWLRDVADGRVGLGLDGDYRAPVEASRRLGSVPLAI